MTSHAGMVIVLPQDGSGGLRGIEDVARLLRGFFVLLKAFLQLPDKKCVVLIHSGEDAQTYGRLVAEGMLGVFLSAAQEYPAVQFRTVEIERDTDLRVALRAALNRGCPVVEHMHRAGAVLTTQGDAVPLVFGDAPCLALSPGDVVIMSGGATGISAHLARCLALFSPRLVFLGRTPLAPGVHSLQPKREDSSSGEISFDRRASEIARTLADLHASGIEATYHTCDVTDPEAVRAVMTEVARRYGRIDGIIHGAGVLRDGPVHLMAEQDFSMVTDVKFLGAWNLLSSAKGLGLRFFVGLSSVAAIQGNAGQANYAAANRMMSALLRTLRQENASIRFKALMLPPIEGAGMAEDPEVRALLKLKGVAYIHVNELTGLFCRELFLAPNEDDWVLFMRKLPSVRTSLLKAAPPSSPQGKANGSAVCLSPGDFPMIENISCLDLRREEMEAFRAFSTERDIWIADHRPCTFVKHALVSAAMILETFMEAAWILYPHLQVRGVRRVRLMDMIQCPSGIARPCTIACRRDGNGLREVVCGVSLAAQTLSSAGRLTDQYIPHCTGQVVLVGRNGGTEYAVEGGADFPVRPDELNTKPVNNKKMLQWYKKRSGLQGRYRVLEIIEGAGPGVVRGRTIYRETDDFAHLHGARYQYSPYLFEALVQVAVFHLAATDPSERRAMLPIEIGNMEFVRTCRAGEQIILEARLRARDDDGAVWDARGIDGQGLVIMQIQGLRMHWVSK